jgi:hypothetical protein
MKTMKNLLTAFLVVFTAQIISANDVKIKTIGNESVIIEITNHSDNEKIKIFDKEGTLLFFESINKDNYLKTFVMTSLPSGKYFIEYENNNKVTTAMVTKTSDGTLIVTDFSKISFKPMFKQNGDFLSIGLTNPTYKNVNISISDIDGYEFVEIKGLTDLMIRKTFNTRRLSKGEYKVTVSFGNESYTKMISIK